MPAKTDFLVSTINVVEYQKGNITKLLAFPGNEIGKENATIVFRQIATANGADENDLDDCLADDLYEQGDYQLFLIKSE